ncbi:MAG TPA: shikimate dehydrogenase [Armatimonadota bacterium]|jgi:shikimate dehydrogenase
MSLVSPQVRGTTGVLCVIGHPVAHSYSPQMHNAAIGALGLDLVYVPFPVDPGRVGTAVEAVRALGLRGMNVTVPHKAAVVPYLDELSPEAARVGAVNTIVNHDGHLTGHNTDIVGVLTSLRETAGLRELPPVVAVLGASGAARGVVYGLAGSPEVERVLVFNRTFSKAEQLADEMARATGTTIEAHPLAEADLSRGLREAGLLVNATSVGMHPQPDQSPIGDWPVLHCGLTVYDCVFNPRETLLLRQATAAGARAFGGIEMLVYQGARSFELWTGIYPPIDVMKEAVGAT